MRYYIISGEASGDLHGSNLIRELKLLDQEAEFRGWGGDLMKEQGVDLVRHYHELAFMGFLDVLLHLSTIISNLSFCKKDLLQYDPDVLILVDYPGFNLRIAEFAKKKGMKVIYYISPQVWAWKSSRVHKIKRFVDKMIVILPFEEEFYRNYDYQVDYVGHPLLDAIAQRNRDPEFLSREGLPQKEIVALLAGSRKQEIKRILPVMLDTAMLFEDEQFVIAAAASVEKEFYSAFQLPMNVSIVYNDTYGLLENAKAALVTSGTATLETALFDIPEVVCYKGERFSFMLGKMIIDVEFISLVNLIMGKEIVLELIQKECTVDKLETALKRLLHDNNYLQTLKSDYEELRAKLGGSGASGKAAGLISNFLEHV